MTQDYLNISNEELLSLEQDYPLEIRVIREMLAEADSETVEMVEEFRTAA